MARPEPYSVGITIVSDSVSAGEKEDASGKELEHVLRQEKYFCVSDVAVNCVADDQCAIEKALQTWTDAEAKDLVLTVGGTGFSPRDVTPEATKSVIEKEAPHLATYMIMQCCEKTRFAALSRSVCGIRGRSLILNLPGSRKGAIECFEAVADLLPHAMDQLKCNKAKVASDHVEIQK